MAIVVKGRRIVSSLSINTDPATLSYPANRAPGGGLPGRRPGTRGERLDARTGGRARYFFPSGPTPVTGGASSPTANPGVRRVGSGPLRPYQAAAHLPGRAARSPARVSTEKASKCRRNNPNTSNCRQAYEMGRSVPIERLLICRERGMRQFSWRQKGDAPPFLRKLVSPPLSGAPGRRWRARQDSNLRPSA